MLASFSVGGFHIETAFSLRVPEIGNKIPNKAVNERKLLVNVPTYTLVFAKVYYALPTDYFAVLGRRYLYGVSFDDVGITG